jgi:hypothetical protein
MSGNEDSEGYAIGWEVAQMRLLRENVGSVKVPELFAYEEPGSRRAVYMLVEGFYGNTLQDVEFDVCELPVRENIFLCSCGSDLANPTEMYRDARTYLYTMDIYPN